MSKSSMHEHQDAQGCYEFIEKQLDSVIEKICLLEQVPNISSVLVETQDLLRDVETIGRSVENFRISSLARAIRLMMKKMVSDENVTIKASSYAYLMYSLNSLMRLTRVSSYSVQTGVEADFNCYAEAIGAIIDHTDELGFPHMVN